MEPEKMKHMDMGYAIIFDLPKFREMVAKFGLDYIIEHAKKMVEAGCKVSADPASDAIPKDVQIPVCLCGLDENQGAFLNSMAHRPDCPAYIEPSRDLAACTVCKPNHNEVGEPINGLCYCNCHG